MKRLFDFLDRHTEQRARALASTTSRRSLLLRVSRLFVGAAFVLPVLPFDRSSQAHAAAGGGHGGGDARGAGRRKPSTTDCDYWRYCSVDGFLCECCGGTATACPPGSTPSAVSWIGTCHNPADGRDYIVNYSDCCGRTSCGRCFCNTNVGDRPGYRMGVHNDINWCMANDSSVYHCTLSTIVGVAEKS
jgi:amicyanin-dependent methylamine dehydrogenase small subunit